MTTILFFLFRHFLSRGIFLFLLLLLSGCASYKIPSECFDATEPLYNIVPRHRCQIRWYDAGHWTTWAIFGNDDEGLFGEQDSYKPYQAKGFKKAFCWWARNPFHNFCYYVIGSAHRQNSELDLLNLSTHKLSFGHYRKCGKIIFPSKSHSCLYFALHGGKPFISLRLIHNCNRKSDFYIGWRERGNFGIKCVPFTKRKK